jgi:RNA-directed DNA polymerase
MGGRLHEGRYISSGRQVGDIMAGSPMVIRYVDDMVALCHAGQQAEQIKARLAEWLASRGLVFNEDKTQIVHIGEFGFDVLGFSVRRPTARY